MEISNNFAVNEGYFGVVTLKGLEIQKHKDNILKLVSGRTMQETYLPKSTAPVLYIDIKDKTDFEKVKLYVYLFNEEKRII